MNDAGSVCLNLPRLRLHEALELARSHGVPEGKAKDVVREIVARGKLPFREHSSAGPRLYLPERPDLRLKDGFGWLTVPELDFVASTILVPCKHPDFYCNDRVQRMVVIEIDRSDFVAALACIDVAPGQTRKRHNPKQERAIEAVKGSFGCIPTRQQVSDAKLKKGAQAWLRQQNKVVQDDNNDMDDKTILRAVGRTT